MMAKIISPISLILAGLLFWPHFMGTLSGQKPPEITIPEKLPLKLRYKVGETLYYRLTRQNNTFQMDGTKSGDMKMAAYFTRTRLADDSQGRAQEKFTWKSFQFGQSLTSAPAKLTQLKAAEEFSFVYSVNDAEAIYKLDFSSLPRTFEGFFFMLLAWDAVTFDGTTRPTQYLQIPDEAPIGAEYRETRTAPALVFSYPPIVTDSKYIFSGKSSVKVTGVSLVKNIPCAVLESANLENRAEMNLNISPMTIKSRGFEHFWAKTYISLADGRIVGGELHGPVAMIQDIARPGLEKPDHTEFLILGYLEMDLLSAEEFSAELRKISD
jgi:hypothetical protein